MAIYTYITDTIMKGTADDPVKKFVSETYPKHKGLTIFYGNGKAVVSIETDDAEVLKLPKGVVKMADEELKTSLSSKTDTLTASKLTSVGFNADKFIESRDKMIADRQLEAVK